MWNAQTIRLSTLALRSSRKKTGTSNTCQLMSFQWQSSIAIIWVWHDRFFEEFASASGEIS
jgi:hypothetical protein